ncbi:GntR family transcriptional regulator [Roseisalinus antarcticus]|uniref:Transcriptional regulator NanR n=1 Tax=Roseisalinus antarcticus TaxID=254357 RepID=A0A1Y5T6V6_9RHOB|nr:GntR family transcriptional regulator [Roseisalinus antarcticus]SLN57264.1 transcriptional regulator NanR [Roseisalinus antarcticus]
MTDYEEAQAPTSRRGDGQAPQKRLSDVAYERILEGLFARKLPAGAFVSQSKLVDLLDIPVAPLRDALRVLETEGMLKIHPRSGIEFVRPGLELTRSTYQFRSIIERPAVRFFAETAQDETIAEELDRQRALAGRIRDNGLGAAELAGLEEAEKLHELIVGSFQNPLIDSSHRRIRHYLRLVRLDRRMTPPLALHSVDEHIAVLVACADRDLERADAALKAHLDQALARHMGLS